ncbi:MAG: hypothetical protein KDA78_19015 [Planctomycetaceae bacterium]|nr:hypothetical protein [Planctomycetaceae bacterium]
MFEDFGFEYLLAIPFLLWVFICIAGFVPAYMLSKADFTIVDEPIPIFERSLSVIDPFWIESKGFKGEYAMRVMGIPIAVFTNPAQTVSMIVFFVADQRVLDFYSSFPGNVSLTTSSTIDGPTLPYPVGGLSQSFPGSDPNEIYNQHLSGIEFIEKHTGVRAIPIKNVCEDMQSFSKRQVRYMLSRPWLILTIGYRYFVLRHTRKNITINQQFNNGTLDLDHIIGLTRNVAQ